MKRKRLEDLYKRGVRVVVEDGEEKVEVWVQKLNPVDHETVMRKANAARARLLMYRHDLDSEYYQSSWTSMSDMHRTDPADIVGYVAAKDLTTKRAAVEAELGAEERWVEDDYLQGLTDAWEGGMKDVWIADNENVEAVKVFDELKRFDKEASEIVQVYLDEQTADVERLTDDELLDAATTQWLEKRAEDVWYEEYQLSALWKAVRLPEDHGKYYFDARYEVDNLEEPVRNQLMLAFSGLMVDPLEGKGSGGTPASSKSSEQSAAAGTALSSGLQAAAQ